MCRPCAAADGGSGSIGAAGPQDDGLDAQHEGRSVGAEEGAGRRGNSACVTDHTAIRSLSFYDIVNGTHRCV